MHSLYKEDGRLKRIGRTLLSRIGVLGGVHCRNRRSQLTKANSGVRITMCGGIVQQNQSFVETDFLINSRAQAE